MIPVTIFADQVQYPLARRLRNDLAVRGLPVRLEGIESDRLDTESPVSNIAVVVIFPAEGESRSKAVAKFDSVAGSGHECIVVDLSPESASISDSGIRAISVVNSASDDYDTTFEDLFRCLLVPVGFPFDIRARPSVMHQPSGVAWWRDDIYFVDERYEHVARVGIAESAVVLPGLFEPKHVSLDRRKIYVANKAADELICANIVDGFVDDISLLETIGGKPLRGPHAMHGANYVLAVADTDNHRVLIAENTNSPSEAEWFEARPRLPFRGPCGVHIDKSHVWVADTFSHRIVCLDHSGEEVSTLGSAGHHSGRHLALNCPVAVLRYREYLVIADSGNRRLCVVRLSDEYEVAEVGYVPNSIILSPFGLSINSTDQIAISDTALRCVWTGPVDDLIGMARWANK